MTNINKLYNFTGDWIAGFTQSDGSFVVGFETQSGKLSIRPRPMFILTQSYTEFEMFKALHSYLGVGRLQKNRNNVTLIVTSRCRFGKAMSQSGRARCSATARGQSTSH